MRHLMVACSICFIIATLVGCGNNVDEGANVDTTRSDYSDGNFPNRYEGLHIQARNQARIDVEDDIAPNGPYTKQDGKILIRQHLNLQSTSDAIVSYEGQTGGLYVYRVYDAIRLNTNVEEITRGWYTVDPNTGDVMHYKYDTE